MRFVVFSTLKIMLLFCVSCEDTLYEKFYSITIINNSSHSVCFYMAGLKSQRQFPDTLIFYQKEETVPIKSNSSFYIDSRTKWSEIFQQLPVDTLSIYLFHIDTLESNTWADVQAGYKILKRYDLSLEDLEYLEYKLSYPPDAKMSGVKMYPPYP